MEKGFIYNPFSIGLFDIDTTYNKGGFRMTKEEFFEEYAKECFEELDDDVEEVCEGIRTYYIEEEEEFYEAISYYTKAHYSNISGFNMFSDSIDIETMIEVDSGILDWEIMNTIYQKATNDTRTLREAYDATLEEDKKITTDFLMSVYSIICSGYNDLTQVEQRKLGNELFKYMISIYKNLARFVMFAPSDETDSYGNIKFYIYVSNAVYFNV